MNTSLDAMRAGLAFLRDLQNTQSHNWPLRQRMQLSAFIYLLASAIQQAPLPLEKHVPPK